MVYARVEARVIVMLPRLFQRQTGFVHFQSVFQMFYVLCYLLIPPGKWECLRMPQTFHLEQPVTKQDKVKVKRHNINSKSFRLRGSSPMMETKGIWPQPGCDALQDGIWEIQSSCNLNLAQRNGLAEDRKRRHGLLEMFSPQNLWTCRNVLSNTLENFAADPP